MLPDVDGQQRRQAGRDGGVGIAGLDDFQAGAITHQPGPAAAELRGRGVLEFGGEPLVAAEGGVDGGRQAAAGGAPPAGLHAQPVEIVVEDLRGIVEDRRLLGVDGGFLNQGGEIQLGPIGAGHEAPGLVHITAVVFAVVKPDGPD